MAFFSLIRFYATYTKRHSITNKVYVGRTSGWTKVVDWFAARKIVKKREQNHHKNKDGYLEAEVDKYSTDKNAIRGREQQLIDAYKAENRCGNDYNGISSRNKKRLIYLLTALAAFGDITLFYFIYIFIFK